MTSIREGQSPKKAAIEVKSLTGLKHILYLINAFFCFILFILSCVTVTYEKDTYGGYNPPAAELAFVGAFGTLFLPILTWAQSVRPDSKVNSLAVDMTMGLFMWLFLLGGVAGLTSQTYDLLACQNLFICRGFSSMMAFAWMSWILFSVMLGFLFVIMGSLWSRQLPIPWMAPTKESFLIMREKTVNVVETPSKKAETSEV